MREVYVIYVNDVDKGQWHSVTLVWSFNVSCDLNVLHHMLHPCTGLQDPTIKTAHIIMPNNDIQIHKFKRITAALILKSGCFTYKNFTDALLADLNNANIDFNMLAHHTQQDTVKRIMPDGTVGASPHVISWWSRCKQHKDWHGATTGCSDASQWGKTKAEG